jgi:dUTPase
MTEKAFYGEPISNENMAITKCKYMYSPIIEKVDSTGKDPMYSTEGSVGLDLFVREDTIVKSNTFFSDTQYLLQKIVKRLNNPNDGSKLDDNFVSSYTNKLTHNWPVTIVPLNIKVNYSSTNSWGLLVPRSSLSIKQGLIMANSVGIIDTDYVKEHGLPLINLTDKNILLKKDDKIAQLIFMPRYQVKYILGNVKDHSNHDGFGSTGK